MPVPSTADQFFEVLSQSSLLEPQQLQRWRQAHAALDTPGAVADALLCDRLLTRFQAEHLLRGKWRNFIVSGKYKILGPLGSGGMGYVYLCEHQVMRRRVAVKVLPARRSQDPAALERFRREARAVGQLDHPNIVGGHDIDQDGKVHFLVMEYVDGNTFSSIVKTHGPLDPLRAAHYIRQAALGLQHAHQAGLVHRDIKPSNLLLDRSGTVKILDLGLARFFHDHADDLSMRHDESPVGTSDFMAPEQAVNSHHVDIRADIYSLGATFYYLLAGHGPFREGTALQKLAYHQFQQPTPIRTLRPEVPEGLAAVIERMMAKEPAERYQTPAAVAQALVPWTQTPIPPPPAEEMPELVPAAGQARDLAIPTGLPSSLYQLEAPAPSGQETSSGALAPTTPLGRPRPWRRWASAGPDRRPLLLGGAAVLLVAAGVIGFALYRPSGPKELPPAPSAPEPELPPVPTASARMKLLIPAYFYPAGDSLQHWNRLIESPLARDTVAIVNPDSGPGKAADTSYTKVLERARRQGVTVIGYVSTRYAARPLLDVKSDVDRWVRFYPDIQGVFFDEQASAADQILYYAALYDYVRKERGLTLVIASPGTTCAEEYLARPAADMVCVVEAAKDAGAYRRPAWAGHYAESRFAGLICQIDTPAQMKQCLNQMRSNQIGYCYITDARQPNPWDRLPSYWDAEIVALQQTMSQ
jgi:serine/threonine protein kinase